MYDRWRGNGPAATLESNGCGDVRAQLAISSYMDGEATATERAMAEWHLADCRACNALLAGWSQDSGRLRQIAHEPEVEMIARAIADQTRYWLAQELQPAPLYRQRSRPRRRTGWALGTVAAMFMALIAVVGAGFSASLSNPDLNASPVVPTMNLSSTLAFTSPTTAGYSQSGAAATPSIARANLGLNSRNVLTRFDNNSQQDGATKATPLLTQPNRVIYATPGVVRENGRN
jgi:predicted anti-sigma-YlaC factor YlaD